MNERIQQYQDEGYSRGEAKKLAKEYVAEPGTSEHELGIAVDINADTSKCSSDAVYTWLANNAYKYGFIKRYPDNKIEITGVNNEPWKCKDSCRRSGTKSPFKDAAGKECSTGGDNTGGCISSVFWRKGR